MFKLFALGLDNDTVHRYVTCPAGEVPEGVLALHAVPSSLISLSWPIGLAVRPDRTGPQADNPSNSKYYPTPAIVAYYHACYRALSRSHQSDRLSTLAKLQDEFCVALEPFEDRGMLHAAVRHR